MTSLFISDVHLDPKRADIQFCFEHFINTCLSSNKKPDKRIHSLYILGDLFEYWIGDDVSIPVYKQSIALLKQLSQSGIKLYIMHGNRDFLMADDFFQATGGSLIPDPFQIELMVDNKKQNILLSHGDIFCTDDKDYMSFRQMVRNPDWQQEFLSQSIEKRIAIAQTIRQQSKQQGAEKTSDISDVNQHMIEQLMIKQQCSLLIHGHTHRPAVHDFTLQNNPAKRVVLPDWKPDAEVFKIVCSDTK